MLATSGRTKNLWRGSLLPLGRAAALNNSPDNSVRKADIEGCFAAQREQAPSPQGIG
ncbi:hypothetical protein SAMN03159474_04078 [Pseudomonas sp. NFACC08-1]|nr:hypothetical protein SAMN03159474_04078 [Pseudomonas sp. NFACC08-1]